MRMDTQNAILDAGTESFHFFFSFPFQTDADGFLLVLQVTQAHARTHAHLRTATVGSVCCIRITPSSELCLYPRPL